MPERLRIVVAGGVGAMPFAGVAWQVLQYLEGFRRLGHDVFYLEDTQRWPYDPEGETVSDDAGPAITYVADLMERLRLVWPSDRLSSAHGPWKCATKGLPRRAPRTTGNAVSGKCASTMSQVPERPRAAAAKPASRTGTGALRVATARTPATGLAIGPVTSVRGRSPAAASPVCRSRT